MLLGKLSSSDVNFDSDILVETSVDPLVNFNRKFNFAILIKYLQHLK